MPRPKAPRSRSSTRRGAIDGLTLRGTLNYNKAEYRRFIGPCYSGQEIDEGCNLVGPNNAPFQDLKDHQLGMAPEMTGALGATYRRPVGGDLFFSVGFDARYSDDYFASSFGNPASQIDSYVSWDAGIRFGREDERWEVALVGKNLIERVLRHRRRRRPIDGRRYRHGQRHARRPGRIWYAAAHDSGASVDQVLRVREPFLATRSASGR